MISTFKTDNNCVKREIGKIFDRAFFENLDEVMATEPFDRFATSGSLNFGITAYLSPDFESFPDPIYSYVVVDENQGVTVHDLIDHADLNSINPNLEINYKSEHKYQSWIDHTLIEIRDNKFRLKDDSWTLGEYEILTLFHRVDGEVRMVKSATKIAFANAFDFNHYMITFDTKSRGVNV